MQPGNQTIKYRAGIHGVATLFDGWQADLVQLGCGQETGHGLRLALAAGNLFFLHFPCRTILRLTVPRGDPLLVLALGRNPAMAGGGVRVQGSQGLLAGASARIRLFVPDHGSILAIHPRALGTGDAEPGRAGPGDGACAAARLVEQDLARLARRATRLATLLAGGPGQTVERPGRASWMERLDAEVAALLSGATAEPVVTRPRTLRRIGVERACEHLDDRAAGPLTLRDIAAAAGVGQRALEYGFREAYGLGPMAYLRRLRLSRVSRDLSRPDGPASTVSAVAQRWGFSHMGQFSRDYSLLFGENPSVTLKRARSVNPGTVARALRNRTATA